jgi:hypothetical protein
MVQLEKRIKAFVKLGEFLRNCNIINPEKNNVLLLKLANESYMFNPWFTPDNVSATILNIGESLTEQSLNHWVEMYTHRLIRKRQSRRVGVVMAGNIPLVGFHDFLCVLLSGHKIIARLSSDDNQLLPAIASKLIEIEPGFADHIIFSEGKLENYDAVIATGSNNSSRYFEYYFRKVPYIIRRNRNGVAVLTGKETNKELNLLGQDILLYFGMGCRSISKVFIPKAYSFDRLFQSLEGFRSIGDHNKYCNNYEYYKSIYLINGAKHLDNGFLLVKDEITYASPPAVLYYEEYEDLKKMNNRLLIDKEQIQCIASQSAEISGAIPFGKAQKPELWDYADGLDTMEFLLNL